MEPSSQTGETGFSSRQGEAGFTLLELLVVLFVVGLLAGLAVPAVQSSLLRARETALMEDLNVMRRSIDAYYADKWVYPESLEVLVEEGYLKFIPVDPVVETKAADWNATLDPETSMVVDVHSRSQDVGTDGRLYEEW